METEHIGRCIRQHVIPSGMSVTEAASRLGVGRPALSNLLNGKASLSPQMALRLERAFGADRQRLLDRQARADRDRGSDADRAVAVPRYVPPFLAIKAHQITNWADAIEARQTLPVLLRRLIHATGGGLRRVDVPGYDNSQRPGWDGWVEADAATPWIPAGRSGWEFGVNKHPRSKADHDYAARLASVPAAERAECTFMFVTPRNWPGKNDWLRTRNAASDWKAVRAYDASDLEQWLETSIAPQIWLAEQLGIPTDGFVTIDRCWEEWAAASEPPMTPKIFEPSIVFHADAFRKWLEQPNDRPFAVAADSQEEAIAFLACLFRHDRELSQAADRAAVFYSVDTLRTLARSSSPFIPIAGNAEVEREFADLYRRFPCIVIRPRNAVDSKPDAALELLGCDAFRQALDEMGTGRDDANRLARESGRSPTILRRRLSRIPAISTPRWASDAAAARRLIPLTLAGAWDAQSNGDREVLKALAAAGWDQVEESIACLLQFDDCPVWSVAQYHGAQYGGVASRIDALFAVSKFITKADVDRFFALAETILSESDPALELAEDQRWMAGVSGKVRSHSGALRGGVCEMLVLLSVHGNHLFQDRLAVDMEARVSDLIRGFLTPLTIEKLLTHDHDLPRYAEAAPNTILTLLEDDLRAAEPVVLGLLKPVALGLFGRCPRSGLLWAMECLAWNRKYLPRVSLLLARLATTKIDDNWANKPIASLESIYRSWVPQTSASLAERIRGLELVCKRVPEVGWQLCLDQLSQQTVAKSTYRPHWRSDASGFGNRVPRREVCEFKRKALDIALAWPDHDATTLGDLLDSLHRIPDSAGARVRDLVDAWSRDATDDKARAALRKRIRHVAFSRWSHSLKARTRQWAREAYRRLEPGDLLVRHAWLFENPWVATPVDETLSEDEDDNQDLAEHRKKTGQLRLQAMAEMWAAYGMDAVFRLLQGDAAGVVGEYTARCITDQHAAIEVVRSCLVTDTVASQKIDSFIRGFIACHDETKRTALLSASVAEVDTDQVVRLFRCAPFGDSTWRLLDDQPDEIRRRYWSTVEPAPRDWLMEGESAELVDCLLAARRPRAAFHAVQRSLEEIETSRLKHLLMGVGTIDQETTGSFPIDRYYVSAALEVLDGRTGVTPGDMAQLEFLFIDLLIDLDDSGHGIPYLERNVADPVFFAQVIALAFKRDDDGTDPPGWYIEDRNKRERAASAAYQLLSHIRLIPGTDVNGTIQIAALRRWCEEVRRLCAERARAEIGDQRIGQLLSHAPADDDGRWPCRPVCEVMEEIASEHLGDGFYVAVLNSRGAHSRGMEDGGDQERDLAANYRGSAELIRFDYPYVASLLDRIAESYDHDAEQMDSRGSAVKRGII